MRDEIRQLIDLDWTGPRRHPHLSMDKRAAQFNPFAALTGYENEIREEGRLTEDKPALTEEEKDAIGYRLQELSEKPGTRIRLTCFRKDPRKKGGQIQNLFGTVSAVRPVTAVDHGFLDLIVEDVGTVSISFDDILEVEEI
ncbi:hypothetical protein ACKX2L_07435 [Lachnospiraceae bacterium YH-ros2228]